MWLELAMDYVFLKPKLTYKYDIAAATTDIAGV